MPPGFGGYGRARRPAPAATPARALQAIDKAPAAIRRQGRRHPPGPPSPSRKVPAPRHDQVASAGPRRPSRVVGEVTSTASGRPAAPKRARGPAPRPLRPVTSRRAQGANADDHRQRGAFVAVWYQNHQSGRPRLRINAACTMPTPTIIPSRRGIEARRSRRSIASRTRPARRQAQGRSARRRRENEPGGGETCQLERLAPLVGLSPEGWPSGRFVTGPNTPEVSSPSIGTAGARSSRAPASGRPARRPSANGRAAPG
jgi:hypothetical protein